jgi:hypothetical protein
MDVPFNSSFGFAEGTGPQTEMSARLFDRQPLRRIWTMMSLASLSLGFSVFGVLIIVNRHQADLHGRSGESFLAAAGGIGGLLIGMGFLVAACLHWNTESGLGFSMKNCQQLARPTRSHKIVHLFLWTGKFIEALGIDHSDRERIQSLGFVDRKE